MLKAAVAKAKLGNDDRLEALRRLDAQARRLELAGGETFDEIVGEERRRSPEFYGRSVFGWERGKG